jgi:hypothetical protein
MGSPMHFMRFGWISNALNKYGDVRYELFKPWKKHDAVVFLKSMDIGCIDLAEKLRRDGIRVVFEANVDYYTIEGNYAISPDLVPSEAQRQSAVRMTSGADLVLASSKRLQKICSEFNAKTSWIPDNIPDAWLGEGGSASILSEERLQVFWSGMASKAIDLLQIESVLKRFGEKIHLNLITGDLKAALANLQASQRDRMEKFLSSVPNTVHPFRGIPRLLEIYRRGGVVISPRDLTNPYNQSHTEWKITLGMAAGLPAIASPQPSYLDVAARASHPGAVTICDNDQDWLKAFELALDGAEFSEKREAAVDVVRRHYSTSVVAAMHLREMQSLLAA